MKWGLKLAKLKIISELLVLKKENFIKYIYEFPELVKEAAESMSPALIAIIY